MGSQKLRWPRDPHSLNLFLPRITSHINKFLSHASQKRAVGLDHQYMLQWFQLQLVESSNCQGGHCIFGICLGDLLASVSAMRVFYKKV